MPLPLLWRWHVPRVRRMRGQRSTHSTMMRFRLLCSPPTQPKLFQNTRQVTITREHLHQLLAPPTALRHHHPKRGPCIGTSSSTSSSSTSSSSLCSCSSSSGSGGGVGGDGGIDGNGSAANGRETSSSGGLAPDSKGGATPPTSVVFPYAIMEIKLADGDCCPDWVLVRWTL